MCFLLFHLNSVLNYIDFLEHTERLICIYELGRCTVIVYNKDNGSHSAHKQRQTGLEGGERRSVRDREGEGGHRTLWGLLY